MQSRELTLKLKELEHRLNKSIVKRCDSLPDKNIGRIVIFNGSVYFWNGIEYERIITATDDYLTEADLANLVTDEDLQNYLSEDVLNALNNSNDPRTLNPYATISDLLSIGVGTNIFVTNTYSTLPAANTNVGKFYWVENSQGTSWLPGGLGGTYYPKGLYYSNGIEWTKIESPYQATQADVDAGLNDNKFVTPLTLKSRLDTIISNANYLHDQGLPSATWTINHSLDKYPSINVFDTAGNEIEGSVNYVNTNTLIVNFTSAFSGKATLN